MRPIFSIVLYIKMLSATRVAGNRRLSREKPHRILRPGRLAAISVLAGCSRQALYASTFSTPSTKTLSRRVS